MNTRQNPQSAQSSNDYNDHLKSFPLKNPGKPGRGSKPKIGVENETNKSGVNTRSRGRLAESVDSPLQVISSEEHQADNAKTYKSKQIIRNKNDKEKRNKNKNKGGQIYENSSSSDEDQADNAKINTKNQIKNNKSKENKNKNENKVGHISNINENKKKNENKGGHISDANNTVRKA